MQVPVELKIKYLNRRIVDLERLRDSLERGDYSFAIKLGHQVKGNAVTFDVPQIAYIGLEIEKAALKRDKARVNILIQKMEAVLHMAQADVSFAPLDVPWCPSEKPKRRFFKTFLVSKTGI